MVFDPLSRLRSANRRQKSDVAQKLIAMCLHELSAALAERHPALRVDSVAYQQQVSDTFGANCAFCDEPLTADLHVEHLDAMNRVRAGLHVAGNVVLSCKRCNWAKRNDDQARGALEGDDGWRHFLSHDGTACAIDCRGCEYWRQHLPDASKRASILRRRRERIESFRKRFAVDALRPSALMTVEALERVYRHWQEEAAASTEDFVSDQLPELLRALPELPQVSSRAAEAVSNHAVPARPATTPASQSRVSMPSTYPSVAGTITEQELSEFEDALSAAAAGRGQSSAFMKKGRLMLTFDKSWRAFLRFENPATGAAERLYVEQPASILGKLVACMNTPEELARAETAGGRVFLDDWGARRTLKGFTETGVIQWSLPRSSVWLPPRRG